MLAAAKAKIRCYLLRLLVKGTIQMRFVKEFIIVNNFFH